MLLLLLGHIITGAIRVDSSNAGIVLRGSRNGRSTVSRFIHFYDGRRCNEFVLYGLLMQSSAVDSCIFWRSLRGPFSLFDR